MNADRSDNQLFLNILILHVTEFKSGFHMDMLVLITTIWVDHVLHGQAIL